MPLTEEEEIDNGKIKAQSLHIRADAVLAKMLPAHDDKIPRVQLGLDRFNDPDGFSGVVFELMQEGLNRGQAQVEANVQKDFYQAKMDRLTEAVRLMRVERRFRADGKVNRSGDIVP